MNSPADTSTHTVAQEVNAMAKDCDAALVTRLEMRGVKSLRFFLSLFMGAFAIAAGIAVFHIAVALLVGAVDGKTDTSLLAGQLVGRSTACAVFAWFAYALWRKNKIR
jgi:small neutral amino acid transporter SnatA (MarC family)